MSYYRRGRNFEYKVKKLLAERGYHVFRCAASKPIDLVAVKKGHIYLLECKMSKPSKRDFEHLKNMAYELGVDVLVAFRERGHVVFMNASTLEKHAFD